MTTHHYYFPFAFYIIMYRYSHLSIFCAYVMVYPEYTQSLSNEEIFSTIQKRVRRSIIIILHNIKYHVFTQPWTRLGDMLLCLIFFPNLSSVLVWLYSSLNRYYYYYSLDWWCFDLI